MNPGRSGIKILHIQYEYTEAEASTFLLHITSSDLCAPLGFEPLLFFEITCWMLPYYHKEPVTASVSLFHQFERCV